MIQERFENEPLHQYQGFLITCFGLFTEDPGILFLLVPVLQIVETKIDVSGLEDEFFGNVWQSSVFGW